MVISFYLFGKYIHFMSTAAQWVFSSARQCKKVIPFGRAKPAYSGLLPVKCFIISDLKSAIE